MINYSQLQKVVQDKGFAFFTGDLNINLIGVRTSDKITNDFDDVLYIAIEIGGEKNFMFLISSQQTQATTI